METEMERLTAEMFADAGRALTWVLKGRPEKHLPGWHPAGRHYWFHRHRWRRSHFDGFNGPVGYKVELLAGDRLRLELPWDCATCPALCVTTHVVPKEARDAGL